MTVSLRAAGLMLMVALAALPGAALAKCLKAVAGGPSPLLVPASFTPAAVPEYSVAITYAGHSSFVIETPRGVRIVTDFNGFNGADSRPHLVTMNNAHDSHYTEFLDESVVHALRGWDPAGGVARHDPTYEDVVVWNIPTNVREWDGTRLNGNSIFIFEVSDLCIAHLGHLHHRLTKEDLVALGRIDVLMVPVDGSFTLAQALMKEVVDQIQARIVLPMHVFGEASLANFLSLLGDTHEIEMRQEPGFVVSRATLPVNPKVMVLPGFWGGYAPSID
jgi:L-ascorbate metabolism protein UlaG (beta-lactamase superfamily)